jgi:hypothetical protein
VRCTIGSSGEAAGGRKPVIGGGGDDDDTTWSFANCLCLGHCHHVMARPQVADGGDGLQIRESSCEYIE